MTSPMGWASVMPGLARQARKNQAIVAEWLTRLTRSGARGSAQTAYMTVAVRLRTGSARDRAPDWFMTVRLVLADDHLVLRQALKALLERKGLEVVADEADGRAAVT